MRTYWLVEKLFKHDVKLFNNVRAPDLLSDMDSKKQYSKQSSSSSLDFDQRRLPMIGPPFHNRIGCNCKTRCIYGRNSHDNVMYGSRDIYKISASQMSNKYLCVCSLNSSCDKSVRVPRSAPLITFRQ